MMYGQLPKIDFGAMRKPDASKFRCYIGAHVHDSMHPASWTDSEVPICDECRDMYLGEPIRRPSWM